MHGSCVSRGTAVYVATKLSPRVATSKLQDQEWVISKVIGPVFLIERSIVFQAVNAFVPHTLIFHQVAYMIPGGKFALLLGIKPLSCNLWLVTVLTDEL